MMAILRLLRVREWVKNLFVFLPLLFGGGLLSYSRLISAAVAFACFSLAASSIYILNDIHDRDYDRLHPLKRNRPIASGRVSPALAGGVCAALACAALALSQWLLPFTSTFIVAAYIALNILYTYVLKHVAIVDVMTIAAGFVLRVLCGGTACDTWVSPWLVTMVFLLTLFIAFGKRRDDLLRIRNNEEAVRRSAASYSLNFIDQTMTLLAGAMTVAYIIYTLSPEVVQRFGSDRVYLTAVFVIAGILRYMQIAMVRNESGDPTAVALRDPFTAGCCVLWLASFIAIIYI